MASPKKVAAKKKIVKSTKKKIAKSNKKTAAKPSKKTIKPLKKTAVKVSKKKILRDESELLTDLAILGIQEKKGREIVSIDLRKVKNTVVDFFIVCHAESSTQVEAIARSVEDVVREKSGEKPWHSEGFANAEWILIDYSSVVVHIFREDRRSFYNLEKLWADAEVLNVASNY